MDDAPLPAARFDTRHLPPGDQFDVYRELMSVCYDVVPLEPRPTSFAASATLWDLGAVMLSEHRMDPQRLERSPRRAGVDGLDQYAVMLMETGSVQGEWVGAEMEFEAGQARFYDMTTPQHSVTTALRSLNVSVRREALEDLVLPAPSLHALPLEGALGGLFVEHVLGMARRLPEASLSQAPHLGRATCELLAACLAPTRDSMTRAQAPIAAALLRRARRYIGEHLKDPRLTPDTISRALGVSRSTLYRLLEPFGGVSAQVRDLRLARVHALLANPENQRTVAEIALQHGFANMSHFSRAFRTRFGYLPTDVRGSSRQFPHGAAPRGDGTPEEFFRHWSVRPVG